MFINEKPLTSVLVKPAGPDCNMACKYCFYLEKTDIFPGITKHRMSIDVLEEMIKQIMTQNLQQVSFGWQGGEPTLMGLSFFEKAVEFQQKYGRNQSVGNGLQTNGILIDKEWANFLRKYKFLVGLSLDGPEHVHDRYRLQRNGKKTWSLVVESAKLMLDTGVEVNALTVLNDYSVQFPEEIYEFHKSLGLNFMQFIPCLEPDPNDNLKPASFSVPALKYGNFLCKVFDLWLSDFKDNTPTTSIRFFDSLFHLYVGLPPPECTLLKECGIYVVVEHNGDIYSCDFFVEPNWKLGNIMENSLTGMLNSGLQTDFGLLKGELPSDCKNCRWLKYCAGGCTKDRKFNSRQTGLNYLCQSFKMFFEHADSSFRKLAEEWMQNQMLAETQEESYRKTGSVKNNKIGLNTPCPCGSGKKYKKCCGKII